MEKVLHIGRLRTTINGITDSITLNAVSPLRLDISENNFTFSIPNATSEKSGYMSNTDKRKLDTVSFNATDNIGTLTSVRINGTVISDSGTVDLPLSNINQYGVTRLSNSVDSESEETAATSKALKATWDMAETKTSNRGTITEIIVNGESMGDYGSVDIGTVLREHQDISGKVDKVPGKQLSTNDFTNEYKSKVDTALQEHQDISYKVNDSIIAQPNGLATLDSEGKVPDTQLRSYVINVIEGENVGSFPTVGEPQKIYVSRVDNLIYRWNSGTNSYKELSESLKLGETRFTAYRGDLGLSAYNHSLIQGGNPHRVSATEVGLGNVPNVTTNNQIVTFTESDDLVKLESGEILSTAMSKIAKSVSTILSDDIDLRAHLRDKNNPHEVSKEQIGLGDVVNLDQSKAISTIRLNGNSLVFTRLDGTTGSVDLSSIVG